jgi:hypothetical protein
MVMKKPRVIRLANYTPDEIRKFDEMQKVLKEYNAKLGTSEELPMPSYTDDEMAEQSGYMQMVIAKECED